VSTFPENALEAEFVCICIIAPWKKQEVIPHYAQIILCNCWHHLVDEDKIPVIA
jgi:hypothetical protein